ncbi:hypothetical protein O3P69_009155 [Scylla paramamosain]|uniref:Uncharacterized protein n=1 Tax=Scylla paramamosain TaxID=85552 RepID=A0AAW0TCN6_SCYPA
MVSIKMSESKEEAVCNNTHNHRQQLLHHQQELERDLEAGSCDGGDDDEEEQLRLDEGTGEDDDEVFDGEVGEEGSSSKKTQAIPPLYRNIEEGCTALGCYSAIATTIVMILGIVALLMYSSPANVYGKKLVFPNSTASMNITQLDEEEEELTMIEMEMKELRREIVSGEFDVEAGQSTSGSQASGHLAELHSQLGDRRTSYKHSRHSSRHSRRGRKEQPPPLRLGEGKLTGPMRFITCYASAFTFVVMTAIIVGLLLISPPFNVQPAILPEATIHKDRLGRLGFYNTSAGNGTVAVDGVSGGGGSGVATVVSAVVLEAVSGDEGV